MNERLDSVVTPRTRVSDLGWVAFTVPWIVSAWRVSPSSQWSGDFAALRSWTGAAVGFDGIISAALAPLVRLIPFCAPIQRLSWVSAFGAGCVAAIIYRLTLRTLEESSAASRRSRSLALGSSLLVTLGASVQDVATVANGSTLAAATALASIWLVIRLLDYVALPDASDVVTCQRALLAGASIALTWLESSRVGLFSTLVVLLLAAFAAAKTLGRSQWAGLLGCGIVVMALGLPFWLARRGFVAARIERPITVVANHVSSAPWSLRAEWSDWARIVGSFWLSVALLTLLAGLLPRARSGLKWVAISLAVALTLGHFGWFRDGSSSSVLHIVGAAAFMSAATRGLHDVVGWTAVRQPRTLGLGATLVVLSQAVSALARHDEASFADGHYRDIGAEAWTDEAVEGLPAGAVVLVRTRAILERLLAAQVLDGVRPDVLIVPLEHATNPLVVTPLVAAEPTLLPVIRDLTINGRPSENAISALADARPLFTEFDPRWEPRLREHLLVDSFFHRVYSQTLGRSDRALAVTRSQRGLSRLLVDTGALDGNDESAVGSGDRFTRHIVEARVQEQLTLLLALGDRQAVDILLTNLSVFLGNSEWIRRFRSRLEQHPRGTVDTFDLLNDASSVVSEVP